MNDPALIDEKNNSQDIETLERISQDLVPWWSLSKDKLEIQTVEDSKSYLNQYYLFPLDEISVDSDCDDISQFINERLQSILAAASHSELSVALVLSCKDGNRGIFLGFRSNRSGETNPELFKAIVNGILPGEEINLKENVDISSLADGLAYGGMITGVPVLKKEEKQHKFNLSSVSRSLYGKDYLLAIISTPVSDEAKQNSLYQLINHRDTLHALAKRTVGEEKGSGASVSESETSTVGSSSTVGNNFTAFLSIIIAGLNYSHNRSITKTESISKGKTETVSENQSRSLSIEQQNGYALELEKIADQYIERMIEGFGSGYWETLITFAAQDKVSSEILAGTFIGELSKPSNKLLPPPRFYLNPLEDKTLLVPKTSSSNTLFPKPLASYITSEELSLISSPPAESVPGYEIQKMPALALTDIGNKSKMVLGSIADHSNPIHGMYLYLSKNDLNKHLFVCGLTGSGKTTTIKHILKDLAQKESVPFLVLESAKRDYRQLLGNEVLKENLHIFTIGDATVSPIRFNPFYIQKDVNPLEHIDYLKAIFNASFSLYGPMPSIVEKCLHSIYIKRGWDLTLGTHPNLVDETRYGLDEHYYCFPTLTDLKDEVDRYIKEDLDYKGELQDNIRTAIIVRLESLCVGAKGLMFNTHDFFPIEKLLSRNTILEMESLADDDDKAFFVGLILVLISEYRQKENPAINPGMGSKGLSHFMVIEEAHRLLKNVATERSTEMMGNPKGKAVEVFCNILAEMRSLGQGVAVVEQIPSKISPDVIKNSNTKIVHRLVSKDDQSLLAGSLSIDDYDALYLNRLKTGHALCYKEGMGRPVECAVLSDVNSHAISDQTVKHSMRSLKCEPLHDYKAYQMDERLGEDGRDLCIRFFNSLVKVLPEELNKLIDTANGELKRLLNKKNLQYLSDDSSFPDYFVLQIMVSLDKRLYSQSSITLDGLKNILSNIIAGPMKEDRNSIFDEFNTLSGLDFTAQYRKDGIRFLREEVLKNLPVSDHKTIDRDCINEITKKIIKKYFLIDVSKMYETIAGQVSARCGLRWRNLEVDRT